MSIEQLKQAPVITRQILEVAKIEVENDPTCAASLAEALQGKDGPCAHELKRFLLLHTCDHFVPHTEPAGRRALHVEHAQVIKVVTVEVDTRPPPTPVGRYRDPLLVTGTGQPGEVIQFYNASKRDRPVFDTLTIPPNGKWSFECTNEMLFDHGNQVGLVYLDAAGKPVEDSRDVVRTEPYLVTTRVSMQDPSQVLSVTRTALPFDTDREHAFYVEERVEKTITAPTQVGEPWTFTLRGGDDAVEPNSTIRAVVNGETFETTSDVRGMFALKVSGFNPGQLLKVAVVDVNGRSVDRMYRMEPVQMDMASIGAGVQRPPSATAPAGVRVVGAEPPYLTFDVKNATPPNGALIVFNRTTGVTLEVPADEHGHVNAALGGVGHFHVLEVATRDVNGNISPNTEWSVVLPKKIAGSAGHLVPVASLNAPPSVDVKRYLESVTGPPVDRVEHVAVLDANGAVVLDGRKLPKVLTQKDPRGPFLPLPRMQGFPPFGQLAVVEGDVVTQTVRANEHGVIEGPTALLVGVKPDQQLNFRVLDAAGRRFAGEWVGWNVPAGKEPSKVDGQVWTSDDRNLWDMKQMLGQGQLTLESAWMTPFTIVEHGSGPLAANRKLHYPAEQFESAETKAVVNAFPAEIAAQFKVRSASMQLSIEVEQGIHVIRAKSLRTSQYETPPPAVQFGINMMTGEVNGGGLNSPIDLSTPQLRNHWLPQLERVLRHALAFVATAYDQGKEPGDVEYDRPMQVVKTTLYAFDQLAKQFSAVAGVKEAIKSCVDGALMDDFPFELVSKHRVPHHTAKATAPIDVPARTSAMSVLNTVLLQKAGAEFDNTPPGKLKAPKVDSATILVSDEGGHNLRVRGRGTKGDVIQIFNAYSVGHELLAESVVQPDGTYDIKTRVNVLLGDGLRVMASKGQKQSDMVPAPTDGYVYDSKLKAALPSFEVKRPAFLQSSKLTVTNASYAADGSPKPNGPWWTLTSDELGVRPFAHITVTATTPDGKTVKVERQADENGRFTLDFRAMGQASFDVIAQDPSPQHGVQATKVTLRTPSLASSKGVGDDAEDLAMGYVYFTIGDRELVGTIVDQSYQQSYPRDHSESAQRVGDDRTADTHIEVVLDCQYRIDGQVNPIYNKVRIRIANEQAVHFTPQLQQPVEIRSPALRTLATKATDGPAPQFTGSAILLDRTYPLLDLAKQASVGLAKQAYAADIKELAAHMRQTPAKDIADFSRLLLERALKETPGKTIHDLDRAHETASTWVNQAHWGDRDLKREWTDALNDAYTKVVPKYPKA